MIVKFDITIDKQGNKKRKYRIELLFHVLYPTYPPRIYVYTYKKKKINGLIQSRRHLYSDGSLCLFPDNNPKTRWDPTIHSIETIILRLTNFLMKYEPGKIDTIWENSKYIIIVPYELITDNLVKRGWYYFRGKVFDFSAKNIQYWDQDVFDKLRLVTEILNKKGKTILKIDLNNDKYRFLENWKINTKTPFQGIFIKLSSFEQFAKINSVTSNNEFTIFVESIFNNMKIERIKQQIDPKGLYLWNWLFTFNGNSALFSEAEEGLVKGNSMVFSLENQFNSVTEHYEECITFLRSKRVMVIGLGSLGSIITELLARSGIEFFFLWDYDMLEEKNLIRHVGTSHELFLPKTYVVKNKVLSINPRSKVIIRTFDPLNSEERIQSTFINDMSFTDLVVLAGLSERDERLITQFILKFKKPIIYVTTNFNATLAEIYRTFPGDTPCWECIRKWREENPDSYPRIDEEIRMEPIHYENSNWPGLGVDIFSIASIGGRFVLQTICREIEMNKKPPTLNDASYNYFIWANKETKKFNLGINAFSSNNRHTKCRLCNEL